MWRTRSVFLKGLRVISVSMEREEPDFDKRWLISINNLTTCPPVPSIFPDSPGGSPATENIYSFKFLFKENWVWCHSLLLQSCSSDHSHRESSLAFWFTLVRFFLLSPSHGVPSGNLIWFICLCRTGDYLTCHTLFCQFLKWNLSSMGTVIIFVLHHHCTLSVENCTMYVESSQ